MQKRVVAGLVVAVLAVSLLAGYIFGEPAAPSQSNALQNILIRPDGSISPANVPIQRNGNIYTFTDNIYGTIKIQKSDISLNGAGYTLSGSYNGSQVNVWVVGDGPSQSPDLVAEYIIGVDLGAKTVEGVTVENLVVKNFSIGMYMWTKNNTLSHNVVSENIVGIMLSGSNSTVTNNYLAQNKQGLFFGFNGPENSNQTIPPDINVHHNSFINNDKQMNGCFCEDYPEDEETHFWDDGCIGNYWSDYNGTDADHNGIGDTAYTIDPQNIDRYPLMNTSINPPVSIPKQNSALMVLSIVLASAVLALITFLAAWFLRKRRQ
jgi:parallel beta-helix repeat protein